jgi:hypothetical protein
MKYACTMLFLFLLLPMKIQYLYITVQYLLSICFPNFVLILFGLKSDSDYFNSYCLRKIIQSTF